MNALSKKNYFIQIKPITQITLQTVISIFIKGRYTCPVPITYQAKPMDKLASLWQGAHYQDNLLQAYRNFHLTMQSILLAIGAGLSVATLTFNDIIKTSLSYLLLLGISILGVYLIKKMKKLIIARGEDVDYFHNQIIEFERSLPKDQQTMTQFKVYQKFNRDKTNISEYFSKFSITDSIRDQLTEKGKGHTRQLLDKKLFNGFGLVWLSFHLVSLAGVVIVFVEKLM